MQQYEKLKVYIRLEKGQTVCMCLKNNKGCACKECHEDIVVRNRYAGWQSTMKRDRWGK